MVGAKLKELDIVVGGQSLALVIEECLPGGLLISGRFKMTLARSCAFALQLQAQSWCSC